MGACFCRSHHYAYGVSNQLVKGCKQILKASKVKAGTKVTFLTATNYQQQYIVHSYYQAALELDAEAMIIMSEPYQIPGVYGPGSTKVPEVANAAILASDYTFFVGVNVFWSPVIDRIRAEKIPAFAGFNSENCTEWLITHYPPPNQALIKRGEAGAELLKKCSEVRYTTPAGTDFTMGVEGPKAHSEFAFLDPDKGHTWDILAGAGIYCNFVPNACNGTYVIAPGDYPAQIVDRERGLPYSGDKIIFTMKDGKIAKIEGGVGAKMMSQWFKSWNDERIYILSHMGIGTDPRMRKDFERYPFYAVAGHDGEWIEGLICLGVGWGDPGHLDFMQRYGSVWFNNEKVVDDEVFVGPLSDEALGITEEDKQSPKN